MIVRNEERHLAQAIQSVQKLANEIIIVDTGSTDGTIRVAKQFATLLVQVPWEDDFSAARNISLEEATGDWIFILDADEILHPEDVGRVEKWMGMKDAQAFFVRLINRREHFIGYHEEHSPSLRLFRNDPSYRFSGAIHEQIYAIPREKIYSSDLRVIHHGNLLSRQKNIQRGKRNIRILLNEIKRNPSDPFNLYNLSTEYASAGEYEKAIHYLVEAKEQMKEKPMWASRLYKILAYCYLEVQRWEEALLAVEEGIQQFPQFTDLHFLKGMVFEKRGRSQEAIHAFHTCLALGDSIQSEHLAERGMGSDRAYYSLGRIYEKLNEKKKAEHCYQQAFQWNPSHLDAGLRWVRLLSEKRTAKEILSGLNFMLDAMNAEHLLMISRLLLEMEEYDLSSKYAQLAIGQGAKKDNVLYLKSFSYIVRDQLEEAATYSLLIEDSYMYETATERLGRIATRHYFERLDQAAEKFPGSLKVRAAREKAALLCREAETFNS